MIELTNLEVNYLFEVLVDYYDQQYTKKYIPITQEIIDDDDLLEQFIDYQFKVAQIGKHHNDGQIVEYSLFFKSPEGNISEIDTEMALIDGWNHQKAEIVE